MRNCVFPVFPVVPNVPILEAPTVAERNGPERLRMEQRGRQQHNLIIDVTATRHGHQVARKQEQRRESSPQGRGGHQRGGGPRTGAQHAVSSAAQHLTLDTEHRAAVEDVGKLDRSHGDPEVRTLTSPQQALESQHASVSRAHKRGFQRLLFAFEISSASRSDSA